jgi:MoaA/NifB/PqqE/SkfB family radical SAM enzyme
MNKETFCIMPFINVYLERNGDYVACGHSQTGNTENSNINTHSIEQAWNDEYFVNLRKDLLNGVKNKNCQVCWNRELRGAISQRQEFNIAFNSLITDTNTETKLLPVMLGLKSDNTCNLKCITCNHYQSSQHEKEVKLFREQNIKIPQWLEVIEQINQGNFYADDYIIENIESLLKSKIKLELQGGEPLISPTTHKILDYCIKHGYTDIHLSITINLTSLTDNMLTKLNQFSNKELWISWDHIEDEKFRFIRYPATYPNFLKNLDKLIIAGNRNLGISFTASIFNILDIENILDNFEQTAAQYGIEWIDIVFRTVFQPDYFSFEYLEQEQKQTAIAAIKRCLNKNLKILSKNKSLLRGLEDAVSILKYQPEDFEIVVSERTRVLNLYDVTRNTDYKKLYPFIKRYE